MDQGRRSTGGGEREGEEPTLCANFTTVYAPTRRQEERGNVRKNYRWSEKNRAFLLARSGFQTKHLFVVKKAFPGVEEVQNHPKKENSPAPSCKTETDRGGSRFFSGRGGGGTLKGTQEKPVSKKTD